MSGRVRGALLAALAAAAVTVVAYLALLGWDQAMDVAPDGTETGPYETWQVAVLALVLGALTFYGGWRRRPWAVTAGASVALLVCWLVDNVPGDGSGLFIVGAGMLAVFGTGALAVAALVGDVLSRARKP